MEWVETTGKSIEAAKEAALDQLGIHEDEAEFEVIEEPRPGLFGRMRGHARVRARVAPKAPRPKQERRDRRRKDRSSGGSSKQGAKAPEEGDEQGAVATTDAKASAAESKPARSSGSGSGSRNGRQRSNTSSNRRNDATQAPAGGFDEAPKQGEQDMTGEVVTVAAQAEIIEGFLTGLLDAFGAEGDVKQQQIDDETIEVGVDGGDLGLLIGPKGQTLAAVQDLSRTVVQRRAPGPHEGRVRVDVSGYRQRRQEALIRFTQQVAAQVIESGEQKALEPMGPADRKVVHDAANEIDGVSTLSEGDEPRRRVVIVPES